MLREIARSKEMVIYAGSVNRDHIHLLIGIPPQLSVSRVVQFLQGKEFPQTVIRIREPEEALLGSASMSPRVLGRDQRDRDG